MSEPTRGPAHQREYVKEFPEVDCRLRAQVDVRSDGLVNISAELLDQMLVELGYRRVDGQPQP
jgi:hypothetical protein